MQDHNIIQTLRQNLQPHGTLPLVLLRPFHSTGIGMHVDFVKKCIDELEQIPIRAALGDYPSNLEKLAYQLLLDSACIDPAYEDALAARAARELTKGS